MKTVLALVLVVAACKGTPTTPTSATSGSAVIATAAAGSDSGSAAATGSAAVTASPTLFATAIAAYSEKEKAVAYQLGHSEEGTDVFTDIVVVDLAGTSLEEPELPGQSAEDYQAKYDALVMDLAARGFVAMLRVPWPGKAKSITAGGHVIAFAKTKVESTFTADGKPFAKLRNEPTHTPSPLSVSFVPGTAIGFVELDQDAGDNYGSYNNFRAGSVGQLAAGMFAAR